MVRATLMGTGCTFNEPNGPQINQLRWTVGEYYEIYKMQNKQPDTSLCDPTLVRCNSAITDVIVMLAIMLYLSKTEILVNIHG